MNGFHRLWFLIVCGALIVLFAVFSFFFRAKRVTEEIAQLPSQREMDADRFYLTSRDQEKRDLAQVLEVLLIRTGLEPTEVKSQLARLGFLDAEKEKGIAEDSASIHSVSSFAQENILRELEGAIQAGLKQARLTDRYAQEDEETDPDDPDEEFEVTLVDDKARDQVELYSKLIINLQEMLRLNEFPEHREQIENLIVSLNDRATQTEQSMKYKTTLRTSEVGTESERQYYYFMAGVIQHLRGKGLFPELDSLYRPGTTTSALDFKVQEAYANLKQQHSLFVLLEKVGIQNLLKTPDEEIKATIRNVLPESNT